jgi:hypothetical protein
MPMKVSKDDPAVEPRADAGGAEIEQATKIVAEFEGIFGKLTATERRWLTHRIAGLTTGTED